MKTLEHNLHKRDGTGLVTGEILSRIGNGGGPSERPRVTRLESQRIGDTTDVVAL